jgi:eukaryotic-like serine/threonine-protein kinase
LILGSEDHQVYDLRRSTGRMLWRFRAAMPVGSSAARFVDAIVIGADDTYCYSLDAAGSILIGSTDGVLYAIEPGEGALSWSAQFANQITSTLGSHGDYGYVGTIDGYVHCLNLKDLQTVWSHKLGAPVVSSPAIGDGVVVVGALDGLVYGLRI